ncbi:DUF3578 domain-containing protein [Brevundimonas sp. BH3]|uniref:MrcB family domain-containing protein n=1 Tax=Brevundimonas sp. BH3 TaxID=3133089 RepID=UPI00324BDC3C
MSLNLLTDPAAVEAAMDEYEALGGEAFRAKYGFGKAKNWFVIRAGKLYDSKAIAGVAVGKQHPDRGPLSSNDFSGGETSVKRILEGLGFTVWSSDATAPFRSEEALAQVRTAWGPEQSLVKYLAVWRTPSGRELALQLTQESVRVWTEILAPADVGSSTHYGPSETRHSALNSNAPRLAQPNPAWLTVVDSPAALDRLITWYADEAVTELNLRALEELKANFKREMPGFKSFAAPGQTYLEYERHYKDELAALFRSEVLPLLASDLDDASAAALTTAYHSILTRKLQAAGRPQNLIGWQAVDRLKPLDSKQSARLGRALNSLLGEEGVAVDRLDAFIVEAGEAFREAGATGPLGIARFLGSCALMLQDPNAFVAIRTDLYELGLRRLKDQKFPAYNDEPDRVRSALMLTEEVHDALTDAGWQPRDLIDIQSFLWVSLMYDGTKEGSTMFAQTMEAFLNRFREVRETPFKTIPDLWSTMTRLKNRLEVLPSIQNRPEIKVDWSLGKGVWASVPWIALMNERETTSTQNGLYIVFLINRDLSEIQLCLAQGTTELVNEHKQSGALPILRARSDQYRALVPELASAGFRLDDDIDLGAEGWRAQSYRAGCVAHMPFATDDLPSDEVLERVMEALLQAYETALAGRGEQPDPESSSNGRGEQPDPESSSNVPYTIDDAIKGLFLEREEFERILAIWKHKKNLVLQGAPGVGKSFIARRLAYALMTQKDLSRVEVVQFHQSYGYEDFIQGYRPTQDGGFELRDGVFHRFCEAARKRPGVPHVFIIDEINRGNLSKIFGELMLLIEHDKRSSEWSARLAYASPDDAPFHVPDNVWLLGMMNTADRSLSMVDYALRRRFAFVTLKPEFMSQAFGAHLADAGVAPDLISAIVQGMQELNIAIGDDRINLGPGFQIGHSFFTPAADQAVGRAWFEQVVETEIRPLLEEYWFDAPDRADEWRLRLLSHL